MATTGSTQQALDAQVRRDLVYQLAPAQQVVRSIRERSAVEIDDYAAAVIKYVDSNAEVERRASTARRLAMLRDEHGPLIRGALENWLTDPVLKAVVGENLDNIDLTRNPAKRIWEELATLYKAPPRRSTPARKSDIKKYNDLLSGSQFDLWWQAVELHLQACNEVLIWPEVVRVRGHNEVKHRFCCGDRFSLVANEDDPTVIEAVVLIDQWTTLGGQKRKRYIFWTDEWHAEFVRADGNALMRTGAVDIEPEDDSSAANPFGRIPHTLIHRSLLPDSLLDTSSGEDLINLTIVNGRERCLFNYLRKMSGFKQLALVGDSVMDFTQALLDPAGVIKAEVSNGGLTVIDWTVPLSERRNVMADDELDAAAGRGINPERYKRTTNNQTATGAKNAERGLTERRIAGAPVFHLAEAQYASALVMVAKQAGIKDLPPDDIAVEVQFAPVEYPEDPKAQAELDKTRISIGLDSSVSICQREHPTWTQAQCEQHIKENMEQSAKVQQMKVTHNMPANPETESASAEANGQLGGRPPASDDRNPMQPPAGAAPGTPNAPQE